MRYRLFRLLALLSAFFTGVACAGDLTIGLGLDPLEDDFLADEWAWALRGGGAGFRKLDDKALALPPENLAMIILDSVPLSAEARDGLDRWVRAGGLLLYAGAPAAMEQMTADGRILPTRDLVAAELFGVRFAGFDPGLVGTYPYVVESSALVSPLMRGDGLRLGVAGVAHDIRVEAAGAQVVAQSARVSPGPDGPVLMSDAPTMFVKHHGKGTVVFLTFSPGQVAACYPEFRQNRIPRDCSRAGSAHALMRWLTANLLWEERRLQLPLLFEALGDRPHSVVITGDVHDHPGQGEIKAAYSMAKILAELDLPLSYYLVASLVRNAADDVRHVRAFKNLEISSHSAHGSWYAALRFQPLGPLGILSDLHEAQSLLGIPKYPTQRRWLVSTRNDGWVSDESAWRTMHRAGVGLVFDDVADRLPSDPVWRVPETWFDGGERDRLFVPIFEHSICSATRPFPAGSYRLTPEQARDIALLASAQAEPCCISLPYPKYSGYVARWHRLFDRLATMGGLTEAWLWHPGGVAKRNAYGEVEHTIRSMRDEPSVTFLRGDVVASWRANRERYRIRVERKPAGAITHIKLLPQKVHCPGQPRELIRVRRL